MMLDDIPEMIEDWQTGNLRFSEVYSCCLYLLEHHEADAIFSQLPDELREQLDSKLRQDWDHDAPLEDCIVFSSGGGEHPATKIIVERARRWIAQHPKGREASS
jgi:hypothetical protein